ncbi:MAG: hypothetical protein RH859_11010 [Longimicrobiales bacterium]
MIRTLRIASVGLLAAGILSAPRPAAAQPFVTLEVPYDLQEIHGDWDGIRIYCAVGVGDLSEMQTILGGSASGWNDALEVGLAAEVRFVEHDGNGTLQGAVAVEFDGLTEDEAVAVTDFICGFVPSPGVTNAPIVEGEPTSAGTVPRSARPGTLTQFVQGKLKSG